MSRQTQDVQGRIAVVTAAGKGVGKVIAQQPAERGAHVDAGMVPETPWPWALGAPTPAHTADDGYPSKLHSNHALSLSISAQRTRWTSARSGSGLLASNELSGLT
jgi:NAD(P)-dependent dehydrogenase (short-subunit alcohol dehydrogenase family)